MSYQDRRRVIQLLFIGMTLLAVALCASTTLFAQSLISGDIAGTVSDPSGAVIANAKVTLVSLDRGESQTTTTNDAGY